MNNSTTKSLPRLYIISPGCHSERFNIIPAILMAFEGGATMLQIKERQLKDIELAKLVSELIELSQKFGASLFLNAGKGEGFRVARKLKTGIHLTSRWPVRAVRREAPGLLLGVSVHDEVAAKKAVLEKADFLTLGSIYPTKDEPEDLILGEQNFKEIVKSTSIPVYAQGGITIDNIPSAIAAGAYGISVMSYVFDADWIKEASPQFYSASKEEYKYLYERLANDPRSPKQRVKQILSVLPS